MRVKASGQPARAPPSLSPFSPFTVRAETLVLTFNSQCWGLVRLLASCLPKERITRVISPFKKLVARNACSEYQYGEQR